MHAHHDPLWTIRRNKKTNQTDMVHALMLSAKLTQEGARNVVAVMREYLAAQSPSSVLQWLEKE